MWRKFQICWVRPVNPDWPILPDPWPTHISYVPNHAGAHTSRINKLLDAHTAIFLSAPHSRVTFFLQDPDSSIYILLRTCLRDLSPVRFAFRAILSPNRPTCTSPFLPPLIWSLSAAAPPPKPPQIFWPPLVSSSQRNYHKITRNSSLSLYSPLLWNIICNYNISSLSSPLIPILISD